MGLIYKWFIYLIKMVIFQSYIKWPEGMSRYEGLYLIAAEEWDEIQLERFTGLVWSLFGVRNPQFSLSTTGVCARPKLERSPVHPVHPADLELVS